MIPASFLHRNSACRLSLLCQTLIPRKILNIEQLMICHKQQQQQQQQQKEKSAMFYNGSLV